MARKEQRVPQGIIGPAYPAYSLPPSQVPLPATTSGQAPPGLPSDSIQRSANTSPSHTGLIVGLAIGVSALLGGPRLGHLAFQQETQSRRPHQERGPRATTPHPAAR